MHPWQTAHLTAVWECITLVKASCCCLLSCYQAHAGQTQVESRSKHDAAIGAGKLSGNVSPEWEVTHHIPIHHTGSLKKQLDTQCVEIQDSLTWRCTSALRQVIYMEGFCLPWAEEQKGLQLALNNKVTLFWLDLHHWWEQLPTQRAGHLPHCKQPCILQLTSAGCCVVDISSYDGKMTWRQMMQTVFLRELNKPLSFETSLIWMFHRKCFKQGFSSKVITSTTYLQNFQQFHSNGPWWRRTPARIPLWVLAYTYQFSSSFTPEGRYVRAL